MRPSSSRASLGSIGTVDEVLAKWGNQEGEDEEDAESNSIPFVDTTWFNMLVGVGILLNAVTMGLEANARVGTSSNAPPNPVWFYLELLFCVAFLFELVSRLYYNRWSFFLGKKSAPLPRGNQRRLQSTFTIMYNKARFSVVSFFERLKYSNILDFVIVATSVIDSLIVTPLGGGGDTRLLTLGRLIRLLRLARLLRLFKLLRELWLAANGLMNAMSTLIWVCFLIAITCFTVGIATTLLVGHADGIYDPYFRESGWDHEEYFGTVTRSAITLFQISTANNWNDGIVRHVAKNQPHLRWLFLAVTCFLTLGLLNVIVGVVVEHTLSTAAKDQRSIDKAAEKQREIVFQQLREIFESADTDGNGWLDFGEVEEALAQPEIRNKLVALDFEVESAHDLFDLVDFHGEGFCTIDDFIQGCVKMTGKAQSKDLLAAQVALDCVRRTYTDFEEQVEVVNQKLRRLDATARAIMDYGECTLLDTGQYRMRHPEADEGGDLIRRMHSVVAKTAPWQRKERSRNLAGPPPPPPPASSPPHMMDIEPVGGACRSDEDSVCLSNDFLLTKNGDTNAKHQLR